jgi:hypothetical protein
MTVSRRITLIAGIFLFSLAPVAGYGAETAVRLTVAPAEVALKGPAARQALLVTAQHDRQGEADRTATAMYRSLDPRVAAISAAGIVTPTGDGTTAIVVRDEGREVRVRVVVEDFARPAPVDFRTDVIAAFSRAGCNQGACHGSPHGKNGFHLSLRGYDPELDFQTLTRDAIGRRINRVAADESLILLKGAGRLPHQGGVRFRPDDPAYRTVHTWIREGCQAGVTSAKLARLEVVPGTRRLHADSPRQQLVARAHFEDGQVRDVTELAVYSSNDPASASVSANGLVEFSHTAEASILVRYLDKITGVRLTYVRPDPRFAFAAPPAANFVDRHVFAKQRELQLTPAPVAGDAVFLRRVYLDVIGTLPSMEEARAFIDSKDPHKRSKLIDKLLAREEYASFWALKWADVLRGNRAALGERGVHSFHRYLVRAMAEDRPMDAFARDLLTSLGNTVNKPAANFYRISRTPEEAAETFAQLFLGVRVQCAKCHNHPFESISQTDYYGLAAFFVQVERKPPRFGLDDEIIYLAPGREVRHPTTNKPQEPRAFGTPAGKLTADEDRRGHLADWLTRPDNRWFAASIVNRVWFHLVGRGVVEPVDDFRDTNPPANPELLDALSKDFADNGYRLKPLMRTILNSHTYQLASSGGPALSPQAANPERYFTHAAVRMLSAEQILDAISQAAGIPEAFPGYPLGTRAIEIAEGGIEHPFLQAFARPVRDVSCECAREEDPSLPQMLHLLNNKKILAKAQSPESRLARWLHAERDTAAIIENVYLATLSRRPSKAETDLILQHIAQHAGDRVKGLQDLQYALFNFSEFLLRH